MHGTSLEKLMELHKLPTRRILLILGDLGSSIAVARKMLFQREAGASWPQTGIFDPSQLFGKESRMFSTATLLESQAPAPKVQLSPPSPCSGLFMYQRLSHSHRSSQLLPKNPSPLGRAGTALPNSRNT